MIDPAALRAVDPAVKYRLRWRIKARANQLTPSDDWRVWLILAGRGWGKTRTGAEDAVAYARSHPGTRQAVVAPTWGDARDTCAEGDSGLLSCLSPTEVRHWNRSLGELILENGSRFKLFSADEPDRLRGPQHHRAWADELAAWRYPEAWDQLQFGLRLGADPRVIVTTTPRPTALIRALRRRAGQDVHLTVGSTFDNADNLAAPALAELRQRYEGTRIGRQELYAELLEDVPGALWTLAQLDNLRRNEPPDMERCVVAIDPAVTATETSDETGIIVAGKGVDGCAYVIADRSCKLSPDGWAKRAIQAALDHEADALVYETNQGGDMVKLTLTTAMQAMGVSLRLVGVHASRGKQARAEPVAALYEQGRVFHIGTLGELEDQLVTWTPESGKSPDRLDALVWAVTDLMLGGSGWQFLGSM